MTPGFCAGIPAGWLADNRYLVLIGPRKRSVPPPVNIQLLLVSVVGSGCKSELHVVLTCPDQRADASSSDSIIDSLWGRPSPLGRPRRVLAERGSAHRCSDQNRFGVDDLAISPHGQLQFHRFTPGRRCAAVRSTRRAHTLSGPDRGWHTSSAFTARQGLRFTLTPHSSSGNLQRSPANRRKSWSVVCTVAPWAIASAAI